LLIINDKTAFIQQTIGCCGCKSEAKL